MHALEEHTEESAVSYQWTCVVGDRGFDVNNGTYLASLILFANFANFVHAKKLVCYLCIT